MRTETIQYEIDYDYDIDGFKFKVYATINPHNSLSGFSRHGNIHWWPCYKDVIVPLVETDSLNPIDRLGGYEALDKFAMEYLADLKHEKAMRDRFKAILTSNMKDFKQHESTSCFENDIVLRSKEQTVEYNGAKRKVCYYIGVGDNRVFVYSSRSKHVPDLNEKDIHLELTKDSIWHDIIEWAYSIKHRVIGFEDLREEHAVALEEIFNKYRK